MIPSKPDIDVQSTMVGEKIAMGIDQASLAFIQSILTDLYSDPELAVIREYSTNARDAHIEAGHKEPIEIRLPNSLDSSFKVKDYGVGLSLDDIRKVYSLYGASTKRETNDQNGMLGLGSKSALTYTSQFTVKAVKDGTLTSVLVTRDETGASSMQILQEVPTDLPNGVEVTVPTKPHNDFSRKVKNFFKYWIDSPVPVLVDGKTPQFVEANWVTDNIAIVHEEDYYSRNVYVHMAGVTYQLRDYTTRGMGVNNYASIVFFVEPGSVDFTPNREDLMYTARTKAVIEEFTKEFKDGLLAAIDRDVAAATTAAEAVSVFKQWKSKISFRLEDEIKWNGLTSPEAIEWKEWYSVRPHQPNFYSKDSKTPFLSLPEEIVIVTGKTTLGITNPQRAKLRTWLEEELEAGFGDFIFLEKDTYSPWTDGHHHVTWTEVLSVTPTKNNSNPFRTKPEHYILMHGGSRRKIDVKTEVDVTKPIGYASLKELDQNADNRWGRVASMNNMQLILIPKAKIKAFTKLYPQAKPYRQAFIDKLAEIYDSFTDAEKHTIKEDQAVKTIPNMFYKLRDYNCKSKIIDPEVKDLIERLDNHSNSDMIGISGRLTNFQELLRQLREQDLGSRSKEYYELAWQNENFGYLAENYPLVSSIWNWTTQIATHVVLYVNAMYENKLEEQNAQN